MWISSDENMNCQHSNTIHFDYPQSYPHLLLFKNISLSPLVTLFMCTILSNNNYMNNKESEGLWNSE